jgi:hypothetical protein
MAVIPPRLVTPPLRPPLRLKPPPPITTIITRNREQWSELATLSFIAHSTWGMQDGLLTVSFGRTRSLPSDVGIKGEQFVEERTELGLILRRVGEFDFETLLKDLERLAGRRLTDAEHQSAVVYFVARQEAEFLHNQFLSLVLDKFSEIHTILIDMGLSSAEADRRADAVERILHGLRHRIESKSERARELAFREATMPDPEKAREIREQREKILSEILTDVRDTFVTVEETAEGRFIPR